MSRHINVSAEASASLGVDVHIVHHLLSLELGARIEAHGDESASVTASIDGAASCTLPSTDFGPEFPLGEYPIPNPLDLPLIATPVLQFSVSGSAQAQASASASASESAHADAGIQATNHGVHPFASFTHQASYQPPSYTAQATVSGTLTGQITVGINGTGLGPEFALNEELGLTADPHANPCWALTDEVSATAGINLDHIIDIPDRSVYDHTFPLAHSGSCAPPTITTTNPGPQTTQVGTPVNVPITPVDSAQNPTTSTATGLPAGTIINPTTGAITGTPTTQGTTTVVVTTVDENGASATTTFTWTVTPAPTTYSGTITYTRSFTEPWVCQSYPSGSKTVTESWKITVSSLQLGTVGDISQASEPISGTFALDEDCPIPGDDQDFGDKLTASSGDVSVGLLAEPNNTMSLVISTPDGATADNAAFQGTNYDTNRGTSHSEDGSPGLSVNPGPASGGYGDCPLPLTTSGKVSGQCNADWELFDETDNIGDGDPEFLHEATGTTTVDLTPATASG